MKPFDEAEVQEEIHEKLRRSGPSNVKDLINQLYSQAIIETKYAYLGKEEVWRGRRRRAATK